MPADTTQNASAVLLYIGYFNHCNAVGNEIRYFDTCHLLGWNFGKQCSYFYFSTN